MKLCPECKKQWPDDFDGCPECCHDLTNVPVQSNINMGNANAISGDISSTDDHSVHDSNNQANSNNASNSYNTTNNTTINEAPKSEAEKLNENLLAYRLACKSLYDEGLISRQGEAQLRELQVKLSLADELTDPIKEEIRRQSKMRKKVLSPSGKIDVTQTKTIIELNTASALQRQLSKLEAWMQEYDDSALKLVYFQMFAMLEPLRYTNQYEDSAKDEYWQTYWAYVAYLLQDRERQANQALASLGRWHSYFPIQNDIILQIVGKLMQNEPLDIITQIRSTLSSQYTSDLQLLLDAVDELLQIDWGKEYISLSKTHSFYIETLFGKFVEAQKALGAQRLKEAKDAADRARQAEQDRIHQQELAQQAAAKAQAEAEAEIARLAAEKQEAENIAKAQELAKQQREVQEAAEAAAKAEAERIEQERLAAIEDERRKKEEEARILEEEKRRKKEARLAWWERNIWYVLGAIVIITVAVFLSIWLPNKIKDKRDAEASLQKSIDNYKTLVIDCRHNIESCNSDNLVPLDSAAHQLVRLTNMSRALNQEQTEVDQLRVKFVDKADNLKNKCDILESSALTESRAQEQRNNRQLIESLLIYIK